jgi:hypothetical protein
MEFQIMCPNHGMVEVGLQSIASIVVRDDESLEVVFTCPECGAELHVIAQVPKMLLATLEDAVEVDERTGEHTVSIEGLVRRGLLPPEAAEHAVAIKQQAPPAPPQTDDATIDRYCEYFRRQLASIGSVEAMLAEIDSK